MASMMRANSSMSVARSNGGYGSIGAGELFVYLWDADGWNNYIAYYDSSLGWTRGTVVARDMDATGAFAPGFSYGWTNAAGTAGYRFGIRRQCRIFDVGGNHYATCYSGDAVLKADNGSQVENSPREHKVKIVAYRQSGVWHLGYGSADTDVEIGKCMSGSTTVYGTW